MCRHTLAIDDQKSIVFGLDSCCGGYFAEYWDKDSEEFKENNEPTDQIGFFPGVSAGKILEFFTKHDVLDYVKKSMPEEFGRMCLDLPC